LPAGGDGKIVEAFDDGAAGSGAFMINDGESGPPAGVAPTGGPATLADVGNVAVFIASGRADAVPDAATLPSSAIQDF
jgi:hypothetical protein